MTPFGGITTIISVFVIFIGMVLDKIYYFFKWKKNERVSNHKNVLNSTLAILIIIILGTTMLFLSSFVIYKAFYGRNNFIVYQDVFHTQGNIESKSLSRTVILRLDEVHSLLDGMIFL